jgi:hypothetical protein
MHSSSDVYHSKKGSSVDLIAGESLSESGYLLKFEVSEEELNKK